MSISEAQGSETNHLLEAQYVASPHIDDDAVNGCSTSPRTSSDTASQRGCGRDNVCAGAPRYSQPGV